MREQHKRQERCGHASIGEAPGDAPIDRAVIGVHRAAADLGETRIQEVGTDGGRRMDAEDQHEKRRHERAAADAGEADQQADNQPGNDENRIYAMQHRSTLLAPQT